MFRKTSAGTYGRRSSQPQRISGLIDIPEDKQNFREIKKSMIPVVRGTIRASSCEDLARCGRSSSAENKKSVEQTRRKRAVSAERDLDIPSKTPVSKPRHGHTPGSAMMSIQRTVRKETRNLSDKAFQNRELCKVREYLFSEALLDPLDVGDIGSKMTLKLFVSVMNVLLKQLFPDIEITLSNYVEKVPDYLKKLKYPGKVARSWLLTANASHSWQHVLGVFSWLVNILSVEFQWTANDDFFPEEVDRMHSFNAERYKGYCADANGLIDAEDEAFFEQLLGGNKTYLKEETEDLHKAIEELEQQVNDPERVAAMALLQQKIDDLKNLRLGVEMAKETYPRLHSEYEGLKRDVGLIDKHLLELDEELKISKQKLWKGSEGSINVDELLQINTQLKTEIAQFGSRRDCQSAQMEELTNAIYSNDLGIAKSRKLLDKETTDREALVRELTCLNPEAQKLDWSIFYTQDDARVVMKEYKKLLEHTLRVEKKAMEDVEKQQLESELTRDSLIKERNTLKIQEERESAEVLKAEMNLMELKEAAQREEIQQDEEAAACVDRLKKYEQDIEMELNKIEEKKEKEAMLKEKIEQLKKENKENAKTYKNNLAAMRSKLEAYMTKLTSAYHEYLGEFL